MARMWTGCVCGWVKGSVAEGSDGVREAGAAEVCGIGLWWVEDCRW